MNILIEYFFTLLIVFIFHACVVVILMLWATSKKCDIDDLQLKIKMVSAYAMYGCIPCFIIPMFFVGS